MEPDPAINKSSGPANPVMGREAVKLATCLKRWSPQGLETICNLAETQFSVDDLDQLRARAKPAGWATTAGGRGKVYGSARIGLGLAQPVRDLLPAGHAETTHFVRVARAAGQAEIPSGCKYTARNENTVYTLPRGRMPAQR